MNFYMNSAPEEEPASDATSTPSTLAPCRYCGVTPTSGAVECPRCGAPVVAAKLDMAPARVVTA